MRTYVVMQEAFASVLLSGSVDSLELRIPVFNSVAAVSAGHQLSRP